MLTGCSPAVESMPRIHYCVLVQDGREAEFFERVADVAREGGGDVGTRYKEGHRSYLLRYLWVYTPDYLMTSSNDAVDRIYDISFYDYEGQAYLDEEAGRAAAAEFVEAVSGLTVRTKLMDDPAARCDLAF